MKIRLLKEAVRRELIAKIPMMLESYRTGSFKFLETDPSSFIELNYEIDENKLTFVDCTDGDHNEVNNCIILYEAMGNLPLHLARDNRIWEYLTHTKLLDYTRKRWPIPIDDEKAVNHIKKHFFVMGARGFERDNATARLWWMALLCSRVNGLTLEKALKSLLYQYDVRANIIERPTISQSVNIFSAIIKKLNDSLETDKALFDRNRFRSAMRKLNAIGGIKLLEAVDEDRIYIIFNQCFEIH